MCVHSLVGFSEDPFSSSDARRLRTRILDLPVRWLGGVRPIRLLFPLGLRGRSVDVDGRMDALPRPRSGLAKLLVVSGRGSLVGLVGRSRLSRPMVSGPSSPARLRSGSLVVLGRGLPVLPVDRGVSNSAVVSGRRVF